jgi:preprotein translocase subunit SecE
MARLQKKKSVTKKVSKSKKADGGEAPPKTKNPPTESGKEVLVSSLQKNKADSARKTPYSSHVSTTGGRVRFVQQSLQFLKEVRMELKKVTWPTKKQTVSSTVVVIVLTMILSAFLGMVDAGLSGLIRVVLN